MSEGLDMRLRCNTEKCEGCGVSQIGSQFPPEHDLDSEHYQEPVYLRLFILSDSWRKAYPNERHWILFCQECLEEQVSEYEVGVRD